MLPKDAGMRKSIPVYRGFVQYFPDAIAAVAQLSQLANDQHNPGEPLHWAKEKSTDELDAMMRHLLDSQSEERDDEGVLHMVKVAWRAMANLQRMADAGINLFAEKLEVPPEREKPLHICRNCERMYAAYAEQISCDRCLADYVNSLNAKGPEDGGVAP